jgi:hypothetical protein
MKAAAFRCIVEAATCQQIHQGQEALATASSSTASAGSSIPAPATFSRKWDADDVPDSASDRGRSIPNSPLVSGH